MIDCLSEFNFGGVHTTRYLITLPEYLSSDGLYQIVKDVESWIEEAPRKSRKPTVLFKHSEAFIDSFLRYCEGQ